MVVPAPGLFSTTTGWPSSSLIFDAKSLALISTPPPGVNPTTNLIGRLGYGVLCASGGGAALNSNAIASRRHIEVVAIFHLRHGTGSTYCSGTSPRRRQPIAGLAQSSD